MQIRLTLQADVVPHVSLVMVTGASNTLTNLDTLSAIQLRELATVIAGLPEIPTQIPDELRNLADDLELALRQQRSALIEALAAVDAAS